MKLNLMTGLAGIIVLLFISLSVQTCRVQKVSEERDIAEADRASAIQFANNEEQVTHIYKSKLDKSIAQTESVTLSLANAQALRNTDRLKHLKEFESLKRSLANLEQSIVLNAHINIDSITQQVIYLPCSDSIRVFNYQLNDEFNTISMMVIDTPQIKIKVPINSIVYWQRKRKILWFRAGKKNYFIESMSPNKLVTIDKQELIRIQKK